MPLASTPCTHSHPSALLLNRPALSPAPPRPPPALQALSLLPRMREERVWFSPDAVSRLTRFCANRGQPRVAFNLFSEVRGLGQVLHVFQQVGHTGRRQEDHARMLTTTVFTRLACKADAHAGASVAMQHAAAGHPLPMALPMPLT